MLKRNGAVGALSWWWAMFVALALVAGCTSEDPAAQLGDGSAGAAGAPPANHAKVTARIGAEGGTLEHPTGAKLVIPPGALPANVEVSMEGADAPTALEVGAPPVGQAFILGPEGQQFQKPVQIVVPFDATALPTGTNVKNVRLYIAPKGSNDFAQLDTGANLEAGTLTAETTHFSWVVPAAPVAQNPIFILTKSPLAAGKVGQAYTQSFSATGGASPYAWSVAAGALPQGLSLAAGGSLSGTPATEGTFTFTVQLSDATKQKVQKAFSLMVAPDATKNPLPLVTSVSPNSALAGSLATAITVTGKDFVTGAVVQWDGVDLATTYASATQVGATIPQEKLGPVAVGTHRISVRNPAPGGGASEPLTFTVTAAEQNPVPAVTALDVTTADVGADDTQVTITGSNFISGVSTAVIGQQGLSTLVQSPTEIITTIPASFLAATGTLQIGVFNAPPGGGYSNYVTFTVGSVNPAPVLGGLDPRSLPAGSPTSNLTFSGSGFLSGAKLFFDQTSLETSLQARDQGTALIPQSLLASPGTFQVTLVNPGGVASNALTFTVYAAGDGGTGDDAGSDAGTDTVTTCATLVQNFSTGQAVAYLGVAAQAAASWKVGDTLWLGSERFSITCVAVAGQTNCSNSKASFDMVYVNRLPSVTYPTGTAVGCLASPPGDGGVSDGGSSDASVEGGTDGGVADASSDGSTGSGDAGAPVQLSSQYELTALTIDDTYAYYGRNGGLWRVRLDGSASQESLLSEPLYSDVTDLAVAGGYLYIAHLNGLARVAVTGGTLQELVASAPSMFATTSLVVDGATVYFIGTGYAPSFTRYIGSVPAAGGAMTALLTGEAPAGSLTLAGSTLYWANGQGSGNAPSTLRSIPTSGGAPTTVLDQAGVVGAMVYANGAFYLSRRDGVYRFRPQDGGATQLASSSAGGAITVGPGGIYVTDEVYVYAVAANGGTSLMLAPAPNCRAIATDGGYVYYTSMGASSGVFRLPAPSLASADAGVDIEAGTDGGVADASDDGGASEAGTDAGVIDAGSGADAGSSTFLSVPGAGVGGLAADSSYVYYGVAKNGGIHRVPAAGGQPQTVDADAYVWGDIVIGPTNVYWIQNGPSIAFTPKDGSGTRTTISQIEPFAGVLALGPSGIYWTETGTQDSEYIIRSAALDGTNVQTLATAVRAYGLAADATNLYAATLTGLVAYPLAGGAPTTVSSAHASGKLSLSGPYLYWGNADGLFKYALGAGPLEVLTTTQGYPNQVQAIGDVVYFSDGAGIWQVGSSGSPRYQMTTQTGRPFAANGFAVYWIDPSGTAIDWASF